MPRARARNHDEKRAAILSAAAAVFASKGFHGATMAEVAGAAGVSKGNLYHYWDSKDALLFALLDGYLRGLRARIAGLETAGLPPEDRLRALIREVLRAYQGSDNEHRVQIAALEALPKPQAAALRSYQRDLVAVMSDAVAAAAPGVFAGDPGKLRAATMSVFAMLNWFFMWNAAADAKARDAYAAQVADLTLGGIGAL